MIKFWAGATACLVGLCAGYGLASRNSSGTMSAINGPYTAGSVISSSVINARLADIETELTDSKSRSGKGDFSSPARTADGTVTAPAFAFTSETGTGLYRIGSSDLGVSINQVKKLELTSSLFTVTPNVSLSGYVTSNLGIGAAATYPLDAQLAVGNTVGRFGASGSIPTAFTGSSSFSALDFNLSHDGANWKYLTSNWGHLIYSDTNGLGFYTAPAGTAGNTATVTERMRIATTGVTIGASGTALAQVQTTTAAGCTTAASQLAACNTTITFTNAFANTTYKVVCTCNATLVGSPFIANVTPTSTTQATVSTYSLTTSAASCLNSCIGWN